MKRYRNHKQIALRLLVLRETYGLSQEALAEILGIGQSAYCELESAHTKLTAERALILADYYDISADELLTGIGSAEDQSNATNVRGVFNEHVGTIGPGTQLTKPRCVILAGPNGAGKTTFARQFLTEEQGILHFVNADLIASGLSPLHPELAARAAGRLLLSELDRLTSQGESIALESTLSDRTLVDPLKRMKGAGYRIEMVFLRLVSAELAIRRVAHRVKQGGHHVPEADVRRRYARGWPNFASLYRPLADAWAVYENSGPVPLLQEKRP